MTIKLTRNEVRFRITESELNELCSEKILCEKTQFPNHQTFLCTVRVATPKRDSTDKIQIHYADSKLVLLVPESKLKELAAQKISKKSGLYEQETTDSSPFIYSLEIDIRGRKSTPLSTNPA